MEGYPRLASLMENDPEYAIYRKFCELNALEFVVLSS